MSLALFFFYWEVHLFLRIPKTTLYSHIIKNVNPFQGKQTMHNIFLFVVKISSYRSFLVQYLPGLFFSLILQICIFTFPSSTYIYIQ